jgi:cysteine desulfurase
LRTIYLDYNATTPLDPAVREAMLPFLGEVWGNASSVHRVGRRARAFLDAARERMAAVLGCKPSEVVFTSGGTEANNLAVLGAARLRRREGRGRHIITTAVEHHAVLHAVNYLATNDGFEVTCLPVDREGRVSAEAVREAIRPDTVLVSVMAANNEIGTLQPVAEIGALCRERGVLFHTDAVQWFGKEAFTEIRQFNADLVSLCAHKLHGPKGAGALFIRSPLHPDPVLFGGAHENERRAGTENLASIAGLVEAVERFVRMPVFGSVAVAELAAQLRAGLKALQLLGVRVRSPELDCLPNTVAVTVAGTESMTVLAGLDLEGLCASGGAACSAGSLEPSHVLLALGLEKAEAGSLLRFSLGRETTGEEVRRLLEVLPGVIRRAQGLE